MKLIERMRELCKACRRIWGDNDRPDRSIDLRAGRDDVEALIEVYDAACEWQNNVAESGPRQHLSIAAQHRLHEAIEKARAR